MGRDYSGYGQPVESLQPKPIPFVSQSWSFYDTVLLAILVEGERESYLTSSTSSFLAS